MLATEIRNRIHDFHQHMRGANPLFINARDGKLKREHIANYLQSVLFLIQHTPIHLKRAKARSGELGNEDLGRFFERKIGEEVGHDQWAVQDLEKTGEGQVQPGMRRLVTHIESLVEEDPTLYISYIILAEYFTVLMAPEWLKNLENKCGISPQTLSVIGKHAELDQAHSSEGFEEIQKLIPEDTHRDAVLSSLQKSMQLYEDFCHEVGAVH